jgi:hypothetical protein
MSGSNLPRTSAAPRSVASRCQHGTQLHAADAYLHPANVSSAIRIQCVTFISEPTLRSDDANTMNTKKLLLKQPFPVIALLLRVLLISLPYVQIDNDNHLTTHARTSAVPIAILD